jgi:MT-A70
MRFHFGLGFWTRANPEQCLLATRGNPKRINRDVAELIIAPLREHSRKPGEVYDRVERLVAGPYCELFARQHRPGWDVAFRPRSRQRPRQTALVVEQLSQFGVTAGEGSVMAHQWHDEPTKFRVVWALFVKANCSVWSPLGTTRDRGRTPPKLPPYKPPAQHQVEFDSLAELRTSPANCGRSTALTGLQPPSLKSRASTSARNKCRCCSADAGRPGAARGAAARPRRYFGAPKAAGRDLLRRQPAATRPIDGQATQGFHR